jgi:hypothetical protein
MSIKNVKPTAKSGFTQGYYNPVNPFKYVGPLPIIYRSSWERKVMIFCDTNENVIKWSSEPIQIKYYNILDQKFHKYHPDYFIQIKRGEEIVNYLVEVKPKAQLKKPAEPKKKTQKALENYQWAYKTYVTNMCKIDALKKFASTNNYKVLLLTEDSKLL